MIESRRAKRLGLIDTGSRGISIQRRADAFYGVGDPRAKWDEDLFGAELITHAVVRHPSRADCSFRVRPEGVNGESETKIISRQAERSNDQFARVDEFFSPRTFVVEQKTGKTASDFTLAERASKWEAVGRNKLWKHRFRTQRVAASA